MQRRRMSPYSVYCGLIVALLCIGFWPVNSAYSTSVTQLAKIGDNVTFSSCNISEKSLFTRLKYSNNRSFRSPYRIADVSRGTIVVIEKPFEARLSAESSGLLMLHNVSIKDRGFYKCNMNFENGREIEREIHLKVGVSPVIRQFSMMNIAVLEDSHVRVYCNASGDPTPDVFWYQLNTGVAYDRTSAGNNLQINRVKLSDTGMYYCRAENYMGAAVRTLKIQVYEKPRVREFFNTAAVDGTVYECERVSFRCEARDSQPPVQTFQIYHNGRPIINDSKTGSFTIQKVRREHSGQYSCVPRNVHGLGVNSTIVLKVKAAPYNCKYSHSSSSTVVNVAKNNSSGHSVAPPVTHHHKRSSGQRQNTCLVMLLLSPICTIGILFP